MVYSNANEFNKILISAQSRRSMDWGTSGAGGTITPTFSYEMHFISIYYNFLQNLRSKSHEAWSTCNNELLDITNYWI